MKSHKGDLQLQMQPEKSFTTLENDATGYKKVIHDCPVYHFCVIKLKIPAGTQVYRDKERKAHVYGTGAPCTRTEYRCSKAEAVKMLDQCSCEGILRSYPHPMFKYPLNTLVTPDEPFDMSYDAYTSGIHFFRTKKEAFEYNFSF